MTTKGTTTPNTEAPTPRTASREQMEELHRLLLESCAEYLAETPPEKRKASMLAVIRAFLRDNGISAQTIRQGGIDAATAKLHAMTALPFKASH